MRCVDFMSPKGLCVGIPPSERYSVPKIGVSLLLTMLLVSFPCSRGEGRGTKMPAPPSSEIPVYGYEVVDSFPHDPRAFTQGLIYEDGFLYESTGLYGASSLRKVVLETGEVVKRRNLSTSYFGEGLTIRNGLIYQLTWRNHVGFVYVEQDEFELVDTFAYPKPGWGLTHDDTSLIASDGTDTLYHLDPETYEEIGRISVTADGVPVDSLNELELIRGRIFANILDSDSIAVINPGTGEVEAWVDLAGILPVPPGPLNGIAFDSEGSRLFVTGKSWPTLFEIRTGVIDYPPEILAYSPASPVCAYMDTSVLFRVSARDPNPGDSIQYTWTLNGRAEPSAEDASYEYVSSVSTTDTLVASVTDGVFSDSTTWIIYVEVPDVDACPQWGNAHSIVLRQNRPNPFRPLTVIDFVIPIAPGAGRGVLLTVHDVLGRKVATLIDSDVPPGDHTISWDGSDDEGRRLPPGVFFCVLRARGQTTTKKITLLD
jgi:glutamine cyclotransferase